MHPAQSLGATPHFDYEITQRPDFALVSINLQEGQKIFAEPSTMASMTPTVTLKAGFKSGFGKTLGRAFGGESMIINTFTADNGPGELTFAAGATGDAARYTLTGNSLMLHSDGVEVSGKWQGAKGFFSGEGLVCRFSGQGRVWIQNRHVQSFLSWASPYRSSKGN